MSDTYYTDADIEMAQLAEAGNMIAAGVCPICEDALDPVAFVLTHPKSYQNPRYTAQMAAECVGPHGNVWEGYHDSCAEDAQSDDFRDNLW